MVGRHLGRYVFKKFWGGFTSPFSMLDIKPRATQSSRTNPLSLEIWHLTRDGIIKRKTSESRHGT